MALPTQLNATEQDTLVKQIGLSLLRAAPRDWRRVTVEYRAVGRYHELTGEVSMGDGSTQDWIATHDIATLFGRLRAGMYREGRGTWFNARYQLDHPSSYNLEYDRDEPRWDLTPPPQAYADELRMFPRSEENVPDWLMRRMAGLGPERPGPRFRIARIFDGTGAGGRPVITRPELDPDEQDRLLDYLDSAPVVVPGRGYDLDRLATAPESTVPIAFHSDGSWIWPAAVNYYLREYGVAPEPELLQHIRAGGFAVPDVPEPVRQAAATHISRGGPPPQQRPAPVMPEARPAAAPEPRPAEPEAPAYQHDEDEAERTTIAEPLNLRELEEREQPEQPRNGHAQATDPAVPVPDGAAREDHGHDGHRYEQDEAFDAEARPEDEDLYDGRGGQEPHGDERERFDEHAVYDGDYGERAGYDQQREYEDLPRYDEREYGESGHAQAAYREPAAPEREERYRNGLEHPEPVEPRGDDHTTVFTAMPDLGAGAPTTITAPPAPPVAAHAAPEPSEGSAEPARPEPERHQVREPQVPHDDGGAPTRYVAPPPAVDHPVLDELQDRLEDLGVPESAYRLGEPAERGWALEEVPEGWRVGWYDGALTSPAVFGDAEDAAAFMLGKLLLSPGGATERRPDHTGNRDNAGNGSAASQQQPPAPHTPQSPQPAVPPWQSAPRSPGLEERPTTPPAPAAPDSPPPHQPVTATLSPEVATGALSPEAARDGVRPGHGAPAPRGREEPPPADSRRAPGGPTAARPGTPPSRQENGRPVSGQGGNQQWSIQPLPGEPPLTLFRGKEIRELPVGSELDRFGDANGNLAYVAGTPFEERSLVPEWINRPYHVYRVQRPMEALAGVAIPWFNQPGGGAAYLLPASIEELLADGDLIELEPGEPPID